jgi:F-type H+-transporting ATPase subunit delta
MTSDQIVAKRYAKALFEVADQHNIVGQVEEELRALIMAIHEHPDLEKFLQHPNILASAKLESIKNAYRDGLSDAVANTIGLLFERGREASLPALYEAYVKIANASQGQADAVVSSPFALDQKQSDEIAKFFGQLTGKKIRLEHTVDPQLLGGIQVRIGDRLYDGSLKSKLSALQHKLMNNKAL